MIGNDVIDLALARKESRWERSGFLDKLFTSNEKEMILNAENPEITVWNLWSRKEAVYKIYHRETGLRSFMPLQIECLFENGQDGIVFCNGKKYFSKTEINSQSIYTIAVSDHNDFDRILIMENRNKIHKYNNIPYFGIQRKPVSISHHGRFEQIVALKD